jgi:predicted nucleic acid-binding protein
MVSGKDFKFKAYQHFLFDTNIWMFLFCPIANYKEKKQEAVSKFLERTISAPHSIIFITSTTVSEFANAFLRLDWSLWKEETNNHGANFKKDYFQTDRCKSTRSTIAHILRTKIFPLTQKYSDSFNAIDIEAVLQLYNTLDYNDALFYHYCQRNNWHLVSDDSDFNVLDGVVTINP